MMWKITKIAAAAAALPFVLATSYPLLESWSGSSFMYVPRLVAPRAVRSPDLLQEWVHLPGGCV